MSRLVAYLLDAVRHPHEQLSRGQHQVRYTWDLGVHCWRQLMSHRAEGMAAELTYRTIFSLIPIVVLGLVMFRVVGGLEEVQKNVENQLYSFFGVPEIPDDYASQGDTPELQDGLTADLTVKENQSPQPFSDDANPAETPELVAPNNGSEPLDSSNTNQPGDNPEPRMGLEPAQAGVVETPTDEDSSAQQTVAEIDLDPNQDPQQAAAAAEQEAETERQTRASIRKTLQEVTGKVASIDFASIGVFGLLLFIYAAIALADSVEHLFNRIYDAPASRPIHLRLAIHWSIITLGSGLLALSLYMSGQVLDWFVTIGAGSNLKLFLSHCLSIGASWVLLFLLYALMPNTEVSIKAAAIGSLVGSLLWEAAKFGFQIYVITAVPYSALYGSLGLIPLFLFWMYVTWLIVLFGLILTYTLQTLRGKRFQKEDFRQEEGLLPGDPEWMLPIMCEICNAFQKGNAVGNQELAERLGLSSRIVSEMTSKLVESELLRKASSGAGGEASLILAKPADRIEVAEILNLAHQTRPTNDHPAWRTLNGLHQAERDAVSGQTLADMTWPLNTP